MVKLTAFTAGVISGIAGFVGYAYWWLGRKLP